MTEECLKTAEKRQKRPTTRPTDKPKKGPVPKTWFGAWKMLRPLRGEKSLGLGVDPRRLSKGPSSLSRPSRRGGGPGPHLGLTHATSMWTIWNLRLSWTSPMIRGGRAEAQRGAWEFRVWGLCEGESPSNLPQLFPAPLPHQRWGMPGRGRALRVVCGENNAAVASILCVMHGRMKRVPVARSAVCSWDRRSIRPRMTHMIDGVSSAVPVQ